MRAFDRASIKWTPIRIFALVTSALLIALSIVFSASATHGLASLTGSSFEIDNDANLKVDDGLTDWANLAHPDGPELRATDVATGQDDDSYKGGVKEDTECPDEVTGSIPNNKSDLLTFHAYEEPGTGGHPGFLNLAWSRVSDPSGTTLMDFEFNQSTAPCAVGPNVVRTEGDLLIEYAIDQGGARAEISGRFWTGTAWGPSIDLDDGTGCGGGPCAVGTINQTAIPAGESDGLGAKQPRTFGEAQIDLRLIFDDDSCTSFGSAMLKSRSSDAFTSQLKDFISPVPIDINNCAQVIIRKQTDPDGAAGTFGFTKSFETDPATDATFELSDDGVQDYGNTVLFGTGYTVTEDVLEDGFELIDIDCSDSANVSPTVDLAAGTVTFDINGDNDVLDCTYTNRIRGSVDILKTDDTGAPLAGVEFELYDDNAPLDGAPPAGAEDTATGQTCTTAADGTCTIDEVAPGQYWVVEDPATVPAGYDPAPDQNIIINAQNLTVSLTFENPRQAGAIEIVKTRKHAADGPGPHPHADVDFTIEGPGLGPDGTVVTTGADGTACVDGLVLSGFVGDYTVTETVPDNYEADGPVSQTVSVTEKGACGNDNTEDEAVVTFSNTPLTDVTVSVDSLVAGGTASTIECTDADGNVYSGSTGAGGDGSLAVEDLLPTDPTVTLTCEVVIDP